MVNRALDYGFNWAFYKRDDLEFEINNDSIIFRQLKYFYERDKDKKGYIKALYLHHLLDFFKETHVDIYNISLVFEKFLQNKAIIEMNDSDGTKINFQEEINEIFDLIRKNKKELFIDLNLKEFDK
jgi:Cu2+-containing amine oxidase